MKKKFYMPVIFFTLIVPAISCKKDFLDKNPLDSVSSAIFWTSDAEVQSALAGVYSRLQQNFLGYERVYLDGLTDNAFLQINTNQANMQVMTTGSLAPGLSGAMVNFYNTPYRCIASCNYFLDNVDKAPITDAKKTAYKAEVRFIRALSYFDLVQSFGGVVVYRNTQKTLEESKIKQSPKEEVYAFIQEDLDFAIANLPDTKYNGHAVKGSAQALKGRVLITQQKWAEAVTVLQEIMNNAAGKFALASSYPLLFTTGGQSNAAVNIEIMFSTQYLAPSNFQRNSPGAGGMDIELGWYSLLQPYQDLVNAYQATDGLPITESPLYNSATPYVNRDPRLNFTIKVPGEVWTNPVSGVVWGDSYPTNTGFIAEKYVDLSRAPFTNTTATQTDQDYIHIRYADVLLMYAEAKNEVSGPDASVYSAINLVRARNGVNMPAVDQARYDTKDELREYIRNERRVEFALEGQRYNDLKRWNIAHVKLPTLTTPNGTPLVFLPKNYVLPFPQTEVDNNPQLDQNLDY
jgi:starch-binding outer membrane protein, SusD/RagB family